MVQRTITGTAWDPARDPIDASQEPKLMFRAERSWIGGGGLLAAVEVEATLQPNGTFSVSLEDDQFYTPILTFLPKGAAAGENWKRGRTEWPMIWPGLGGDISALAPFPNIRGVVYGFGPLYSWPWPVVYLDLADPQGIGVYGVAGARIGGAA